MSEALSSEVAEAGSIGAAERAAMSALYAGLHRPACAAVFAAGLAEKCHAVLLRDGFGTVQGISTIRTWPADMRRGRQRVVGSGDTGK